MDRQAHRHYWLRQDFDAMMEMVPGNDPPLPEAKDTSFSLTYPKSVKGAVAELNIRGLKCDEADMESMVKAGIVTPRHGEATACTERNNANLATSTKITVWSAADIDAAAEWLYKNERWNPWTHYCWMSNLRFGQAVRAHRYMCARYRKGFSVSFDGIGIVTVIEPSDDPADYARVQFYPRGPLVKVKDGVSRASVKPGINPNRRHGDED